jgi:hypothetical protein
MRKLWEIFSPLIVEEMDSKTVLLLAGESKSQLKRRQKLKVRVERLSQGLIICKSCMSKGATGEFGSWGSSLLSRLTDFRD